MKRNIFLLLVTTFFFFFFMYFYDERIRVLNKEYVDSENDVYIEYPYFNNKVIDGYINDYLNKIVDKSSDYELFMDYDYNIDNEIVSIYFYVNRVMDNVESRGVRKLEIDLGSGFVTSRDVMEEDDDISIFDVYQYKVLDKDSPMVALTFDDGPNYNTSRVLDILEKYNVKATFFVLGTNIEGNEGILKRMNDLGMEIGNHMFSHKLATRLKNDKIEEEIKKVDDLVFDVVGCYPTLVRPSYGTVNKRVRKVIDKPIIVWDIDTLDWKYHSSKRISNNILKKVKDGDIVLMHDIYSATANSLEITIPRLLEEGYQLVTVSELFYYKDKELKKGYVYGSSN